MPYYSSSEDLSSIQLLSPIIPHQQSRVHFFIRFYIYLLFCHPPSGYPISHPCILYPVLSFQFISHHPHQQTIFQFISRHKFSSIIVTHHLPWEDQNKFCYQNLCLLIIPSLPIRIAYIILIIVTSHVQCLFFHLPLPPTHIRRPYYSSSEDLSSIQLLSPIIPHQQSRVHFFIRFYIYLLFCHPPSGYPISYQLSPSPITSAYFCSFLSHHPPHQTISSSSEDLSSIQFLSPIIPHQQSRVNFFIRLYVYWLLRHPPSGYPV